MIKRFDDTKQAIEFARKNDFYYSLRDNKKNAMALWSNECLEIQKKKYSFSFKKWDRWSYIIHFRFASKVVYIPMKWIKESLNVWQSSAIFMWELELS